MIPILNQLANATALLLAPVTWFAWRSVGAVPSFVRRTGGGGPAVNLINLEGN